MRYLPHKAATSQDVVTNEYILDASAIRGISSQLLKQFAETGARLSVSTITVYELFKPIDFDFDTCRVWISKLQYCAILDHPNDELFDAIGDSSLPLPKQRVTWREREAVEKIISIVQAARKFKDVNDASFVDSLGQRRSAENCGQLARDAINRLSQERVARSVSVIGAM